MELERKSDHPILDLIIKRRALRAFSGEAISDEEIFSLFEAARWAPSAYNNQPWRFVYGKKGTNHFDVLFDLLIDFNKQWCVNAAMLAVVIAKKNFEHNGKFSITHAFDTGAAWQNIGIEATAGGLVAHGMQGFDYEKCASVLGVPDDCVVLAMFAVGKKGSLDVLPKELQEKEKPSTRKPIDEFVFEGKFGNKKKSSRP